MTDNNRADRLSDNDEEPRASLRRVTSRNRHTPSDDLTEEEPVELETEEEETPSVPVSNPVEADEAERIRRAAFAITAVWEGSSGYANYQNYDAGVVSYGKHQVTLASGNLAVVVGRYLEQAAPGSPAARVLTGYIERLEARDEELREDETLRQALIDAAAEQAMRDAQDETIITNFWQPALHSADIRGLVRPLSLAFLFDAAIQHGPYHMHLVNAEKALGGEPKTHIEESGLTEESLMAEAVRMRLRAMQSFAERTNLRGVIPRAQFWVDLITAGDWDLQGDEAGQIEVNRRMVSML